ncbi:MAG: FAD-dependent oxidoreductase, partial [Phycisphaerae bacterium]
GFAMEPNALHIWPRRAFMMIALPNADATYTCTLFWPFEGDVSFDALQDDQQVRSFFERHFPDAVPLMPRLAEDFRQNPVGSLVTTRCHPYHYGDKVVMLGDAAHAVVPFYGQGMNAAFEDCTVLTQCIERYAPDWSEVLAHYTRLRRDNCNALADLAIANFLEMRDRTGSAAFRWKKWLEQTLHKLLGRRFVPLYSMISFSRIPYAEAVAVAQRRGRLLARLTAGIGVLLLLLLAVIVWR